MERTIEEKAKAYDEAIERANELNYVSDKDSLQRKTVELIFPELIESEDERIRKELINAFKEATDSLYMVLTPSKREAFIAWLEKQGEQKPANKVEPKFKVGDWVVTDFNNVVQIKAIENSEYVLENRMRFSVDYVDKCWRKWTIQDAKDGDVLEFGDHGRLVVGIVSYINKSTGKVDVYCLLEANNFKLGNYYALDTINPHPATKEQRDLLFQKMKEAGFEWDIEKKELKKIELKPTEGWYDFIRWFVKQRTNDYTLIPSDDDIHKWGDNILNHARKVLERNTTEWSEEDNKIIEEIINDIECARAINYHAPKEGYEFRENWLKSLRPQSQWKPSDKQIEAVRIAAEIGTANNSWAMGILKSMYQDLKKLKG